MRNIVQAFLEAPINIKLEAPINIKLEAPFNVKRHIIWGVLFLNYFCLQINIIIGLMVIL